MASLDLTTLANIKILNPAIQGTTKDPLISRLISTVSRQFERWLDCEFLKASRTEVFSVRPAHMVFHLKAFPVDTTQTFAVKNEFSGAFSTVSAIADVNYYVDAARARLVMRDQYYALVYGPGTLQVTYTGGISTTTALISTDYQDLVTACEMQVLHDLQRNPNYGSSDRSVGGGGQHFDSDEKYDSPFIPRVVDLLEQYRRGAGIL